MDEGKKNSPYKILNVTITTSDPLVAEVLASARRVKRLNAVLGMMLEAYLATPEGRVMAAQQLRVPISELPLKSPESPGPVSVMPAHLQESVKGEKAETPRPKGAKAINLDSLVPM